MAKEWCFFPEQDAFRRLNLESVFLKSGENLVQPFQKLCLSSDLNNDIVNVTDTDEPNKTSKDCSHQPTGAPQRPKGIPGNSNKPCRVQKTDRSLARLFRPIAYNNSANRL